MESHIKSQPSHSFARQQCKNQLTHKTFSSILLRATPEWWLLKMSVYKQFVLTCLWFFEIDRFVVLVQCHFLYLSTLRIGENLDSVWCPVNLPHQHVVYVKKLNMSKSVFWNYCNIVVWMMFDKDKTENGWECNSFWCYSLLWA